MDLHESEPYQWRIRLNVLARLAVSIGTEAEVSDLWAQWDSALAAMTGVDGGTAADAATLIETAAILGRRDETYEGRVLSMALALGKLASGPRGACVEAAGTFARRLRIRLPAAMVSQELSRAIITANFQ